MTTRIYVVSEDDSAGAHKHLVRANTPAQAIRHVARGRFSAEVASQDALVALLAKGKAVEDAGAE